MKKTFAVLLVLVLLFAVSACTKPTGDRVNNTQPPTEKITDASVLEPSALKENSTIFSTANDIPTDNKEIVAVTPESLPDESTPEVISRDRAIEIALESAGLAKENVFDLEAEIDRERGNTYWEVDFDTREYEYSFDINSTTGEIVHQKKEIND